MKPGGEGRTFLSGKAINKTGGDGEASQELAFTAYDLPDPGPGNLHVLFHLKVSGTWRVVTNTSPLQWQRLGNSFKTVQLARYSA